MASAEHERLERVFSEVVACPTPAEQAAAIQRLCGDNAVLRSRIDALLRAHRTAGTFLDAPLARAPVALAAASGETPGAQVGRYKLLELIGEGGFGAVYLAEQQTPVRRKVALKVIKFGMDTQQVIARFEAERQTLALMDHPNIARVLDAGATATGRPYFVMELVVGSPIMDFCNHEGLGLRQRLALFVQICHAVQHAHQKGIIHRDIKPSNVLITVHDGHALPKVIDFGIAKATGQSAVGEALPAELPQLIGTPEYMSPDQAESLELDIDTRTDIYSLGVLLYVLLTGTTPLDCQTLRGAAPDEMKRILREAEPDKPSARVRALAHLGVDSVYARAKPCLPAGLGRLRRHELDCITMKALAKDRTRRYQTASELAQDVERFLRDEPVLAGPPRVWYRGWKFVRRNRVGVGAALSVVLALAAGLVVSTRYYWEAAHGRDLACQAQAAAAAEAQRSERIADMLQNLFVSTNPEQALSLGVDVEGVLREARAAFGEDHASVAATLASRAAQVELTGDLEGAEQLFHESLRLWRAEHGDNNVNVAATLRALGQLQALKGNTQAAEEAYRECIQITRGLPGGPKLILATALSHLADLLANSQRYDEAIDSLQESLRIRKAAAPAQTLQLATTLETLVNTMLLAGREEAAREFLPELLNTWRMALPPNGPILPQMLTNVARVYLGQNNAAAAEPLLREALDAFQTPELVGVPQHVLALDSLNDIFMRRNLPAEILPLAEHSLRAAQRAGNQPAVQELRKTVGNFCWYVARSPKRSAGEFAAALQTIQACLQLPPEDFRLLNTLGVLQYRLGEHADALFTLRRCDAHNSLTYPDGHPADTAFIALTCHQLGQSAEAHAALSRLQRAVLTDPFAADQDCRNAAREAEALLGGETRGAQSRRRRVPRCGRQPRRRARSY